MTADDLAQRAISPNAPQVSAYTAARPERRDKTRKARDEPRWLRRECRRVLSHKNTSTSKARRGFYLDVPRQSLCLPDRGKVAPLPDRAAVIDFACKTAYPGSSLSFKLSRQILNPFVLAARPGCIHVVYLLLNPRKTHRE